MLFSRWIRAVRCPCYVYVAGRILGHDNLSHKAAKCMPVLFFGPAGGKSGFLRACCAFSASNCTFMVLCIVLVRCFGALRGLMQIVGQSLNNFRYNPRPCFLAAL